MSKWGDEAEKLEEEGEGVKTVVEYRTNEQGQKVKVTRQVRVYKNVRRVNKRVEERRKRWKKFGKCANATGPEPGISAVAEPVLFILGEDARRQKELEEKLKKDQAAINAMYKSITAEATGGPGAGAATAVWRPRFREGGGAVPPGPGGPPGSGGPGLEGASGRYVPVHLRGKQGGAPGAAGSSFGRDDSATLRVSNLSEDTSEADLETMFRPFGGVQRIFVAKDKETFRSKGFAFVSFYTRRDAQAAKDALDGKGWDYLILSVDWAEDKKPF